MIRTVVAALMLIAAAASADQHGWTAGNRAGMPLGLYRVRCLRAAIVDLRDTWPDRYPDAAALLAEVDDLERSASAGGEGPQFEQRLRSLQQRALLRAPPLADLSGILLVRRTVRNPLDGNRLGIPSPHECVSALPRQGWDNQIMVLAPPSPQGSMRKLFDGAGGYCGELDLHWNADRLLFTRSDRTSWKIWEIGIDGRGLRQVSAMPDDVHSHGACYTPGRRIIFGSTAPFQSVPCWHGLRHVSVLYAMNEDGSRPRQLCFDQDHDYTPSVLPDGQVVFLRWDYTGIAHIYLRQLMVMNPDGTGQRAIYGSNSWYPNSLFFPRALGATGRLACILSGYHGVHRMGQLVVVDTSRGWHETDGLVLRISGRGDPIERKVRDDLVDDDWPKFLHPYPLDDKRMLVSALMDRNGTWGIYLADVFDNLVLIHEEPGAALLEPIPITKRPMPPVIPDRVDESRTDAVVYLHDVYRGPGLAGVPRGTVKSLRVVAYHFAYMSLAGPDLVGRGGPWEVMRILGTVPLEPDGSAVFRVPADTPIAVQALDGEGKAVQLMRSWFSARRGEYLSCVGCHEKPADAPPASRSAAATMRPRDVVPWRGPARGFSFAREVQPVLNRYCVSCHDGTGARPDLRPREQVSGYRGLPLPRMVIAERRLHPLMSKQLGGRALYTPAYEALIHYIRRPGVEDDVRLLVPGEYHADTSELVQMLARGHGGVRLDEEAWDRIITWIDLNAPCHGTWREVFDLPGLADRRMALRRMCNGPQDDPESVPAVPAANSAPVAPAPATPPGPPPAVDGWPFDEAEARRRQRESGPWELTIDMGGGVTMKLVRIPAGEFVMGDARGQPDEQPLTRVAIRRPFWMGVCEVTNAQYRRFDAGHSGGYYAKRLAPPRAGAAEWVGPEGEGLDLDGDEQPAVRVSWEQAMAFCGWLSRQTGRRFTLPTEAQWEYACRAGTAGALWFGETDTDFSRFANMADRCFSAGLRPDGRQITGGIEHLVIEGAALADRRFSDGAVVTAPVGRYAPNPWGLYDMHGNAAEWTRSIYRPYPWREEEQGAGNAGDAADADGAAGAVHAIGGVAPRRVVRGGSFFDRPARCRSAVRLAYPQWQRVFNVGFRVVME